MAATLHCSSCSAPLTSAGGGPVCFRCLVRRTFAEENLADEGRTDPPLEAAATADARLADDHRGSLPLPRRFGEYELLAELGRGGMGVVYKARQVGLDRMVAVKLMQAGAAAPAELLQRFEREARAAATLRHPGIVPIHEVGQVDGQPYFSMELLPGGNLAERVRERPLAAVDAASCVQRLSEAMACAHERGILHRDLKPANILIDEGGSPRITDFGLAKRLQDGSELTLTRQILGTPQYMPPEQVRGVAGPGSDIYALGAVLYHLLTGRPPFQAATIEEVLLQVIDRDPVSPRSLNPTVPRDLETICLQCLEKDPDRRYRSASDLAEDCGRWLRHEPIAARPHTPWSRAWKWARRQPAVAALTAALLGTVITGFVVTLRQLSATERARRETELSLARATREGVKKAEFSRFLTDMLAGVGPGVALGRDTVLLREILDQTNERLDRELRGEPELEAELRSTLGRVFLELGEARPAESAFRRVLALESAGGSARARETAQALTHLGIALHKLGRLPDAERRLIEGVALHRSLPDDDEGLAHALNNLSILRADLGQLAAAESLQREVLALRQKRGTDPAAVANSLANLGAVVQKLGRLPEAESLHREALVVLRKLPNEGGLNTFTVLNNLASMLRQQGRLAEAGQLLAEAREAGVRLAGPEHPRLVAVLGNLGGVLEEQGRLREAEQFHREALGISRKHGEQPAMLARALNNLASVLQRQGSSAQAETLHREALALRRVVFGNENGVVAESMNNLADALYSQEKWTEAETLHREALALRRRVLGPEDPAVAISLNNLARVRHRQGGLEDAEMLHRDALALRRRVLPADHPDIAISLINLAQVLNSRGQSVEPERLLQEALALRRTHFGEIHRDTASVWNSLGTLYYEQRRWAQAQAAYEEVLRIRTQVLQPEHLDVARAQRNLGLVLVKQGRSTDAATLLRGPMVATQARIEKLLAEHQPAVAEPIARENLRLWSEFSSQTWRRFHAECLLGACLLEQGRTREAQPFLVSGQAGLERLSQTISPENALRVRGHSLKRMAQFHRDISSDQAAEWQKKLADLEANPP